MRDPYPAALEMPRKAAKATTRRIRNHKGRGVGEPEDWSGVLTRSAKSMGAKRPALLLETVAHRYPV